MTFEWSAIWAAWPDLMAGSWMTIQITLLGLIGASAVLICFGVIAWRGLRISMRAEDTFGSLRRGPCAPAAARSRRALSWRR